jgi:signal transduction histidine kinase
MKFFQRIKKILTSLLFQSFSKWQIKITLILGATIVFVSAFIYINSLVDSLIKTEKNYLNYYADIIKRFSDPNANTEDLIYLIEKISPTITFPMIMTDNNDEPLEPFSQYMLNIKLDSTLSKEQQKEFLKNKIKEMKSYDPISVADNEGKLLAKLYYNHSDLISNLKIFPLIEVLIVSVLILIGYLAFSSIKKNEESRVWVGMSKEAAHQLGTPLSSLMAWMELLKYNKDNPEQIEETVDEMQNDINRLSIIATRFSKIGSKPEKKIANISAILEEVSVYFEKRLPHLGRKVEIIREIESEIFAEVSPELFAWVFENLLKNSAEAIETKKGFVKIEAKHKLSKLIIIVSDNGKGLLQRQKKLIFEPGYTTKKRGWGLGLSLSKRIIEEYHEGKIYVKDTQLGKGTTFCIELPI